MPAPLLSFSLILVAAFSLCTYLEPWFLSWAGNRTGSGNVLQVALGDGRKLLARQFYTKADAYFHNGYHPTIYDTTEGHQEDHLSGLGHAGDHEEGEEGSDFLGKPKDWIDAFGRHFYPSRHSHLEEAEGAHVGEEDQAGPEARPGASPARAADSDHEGGHDKTGLSAHDAGHDADHDAGHGTKEGATRAARAAGSGAQREILPWLRLSAELDPQRVETYTVASFWLRRKLGKVAEAEAFLREGLRANPGDYEILLELGRIQYQNHQDTVRARNLWELALKDWTRREAGQTNQNLLAYAALLNNLAMAERDQNNYPQAIRYYTALKEVAPHPDLIQGWIDYLKTNGPPIKLGVPQ